MKIHICPRCGGGRFIVSARVTQDWVVNEYGNFEEELNMRTQVEESPDDDDIWQCEKCGYDALGSEFLCEGENNDRK